MPWEQIALFPLVFIFGVIMGYHYGFIAGRKNKEK